MVYINIKSLEKVEKNILKRTISKTWNIFILKEYRASSAIKILINHFQVIYLVNSYNFRIPGFIKIMAGVIANPGEIISHTTSCGRNITTDTQ